MRVDMSVGTRGSFSLSLSLFLLLCSWCAVLVVRFSFYACLCSLCDCDYVLLYYFDLVIRSAGSQKFFFGHVLV